MAYKPKQTSSNGIPQKAWNDLNYKIMEDGLESVVGGGYLDLQSLRDEEVPEQVALIIARAVDQWKAATQELGELLEIDKWDEDLYDEECAHSEP